MKSSPGSLNAERASPVAVGIARRAGQLIIIFFLQGAILFGASGEPGWVWAWICLGISLLSMLLTGTIMLRKNPEAVAERGNARPTEMWDKVVATLYGLSLFLAVPLVSGFDRRWGWSHQVDTPWHIIGAVLLALGLALANWAMITNAFFSTAVRIQTDRGQTVCRDGPYRTVRHPGYVGFILQAIATPVLLGSLWALPAGALAGAALIVRTMCEDRTLRTQLPGYDEYAKEVRYRLVPGLW
jgi:protein-S-isoprenylcysteine O-methyltransferase Ste14